jgi:hypothetical protein
LEGTVILLKGIIVLAVGLLSIGLGIHGWRVRRQARISLLEAAILRLGDADPLPFNRWDRAMAYVQPVLMLIFGPFLVVLGIILILF